MPAVARALQAVLITPYPIWKISLARRIFKRGWEALQRRWYRLVIEPRSREIGLEEVDGLPLLVLPEVFAPKLFRTGAYLARQLNQKLIPPGCAVLDLGAGAGIGAITAARWAGRVVAVDINPAAVRCAQANCLLNQVDERVDVRQGDLFASVTDERFDVILFNPPFLPGVPQGPFEQAFFSTGLADRFAEALAEHLNPDGTALLLLSSMGETQRFLQALRWRGFYVRVLHEREWINERLTLYQVTHSRAVWSKAYDYLI